MQAGLIGKGKNSNTRTGSSGGSDRISRPLATLKDPSSFGPPPKNVNFHGGAALPNQITPDRRGLGAPLPNTLVESAERAVKGTEETAVGEQAKPAGPPVPFRANRTGLKTDQLPPPPLHRAINGDGENAQATGIAHTQPKSKPSLPPRLPPRGNSSNLSSPIASSPPPPTYDSVVDKPKPIGNTYINQEASTRLGKAGISVPDLGIGKSDNKTASEGAHATSSPTLKINELQSRFSRMNSNSTPPQITPPGTPAQATPNQGTTLAQKQAALQTAQSFNRDPSSVSLSDAKSAASTANNFRERHHEQISAGAQKANSWNKKYNITGRMNSFLEQQSTPAQQQQTETQQPTPPVVQNQSPSQSTVTPMPDLGRRKAPPPPPPKKPSGMHGQAMAGGQTPPPVPLGTKPSFG
jgi:hypothetical protein